MAGSLGRQLAVLKVRQTVDLTERTVQQTVPQMAVLRADPTAAKKAVQMAVLTAMKAWKMGSLTDQCSADLMVMMVPQMALPLVVQWVLLRGCLMAHQRVVQKGKRVFLRALQMVELWVYWREYMKDSRLVARRVMKVPLMVRLKALQMVLLKVDQRGPLMVEQ